MMVEMSKLLKHFFSTPVLATAFYGDAPDAAHICSVVTAYGAKEAVDGSNPEFSQPPVSCAPPLR